MQQIREDFSNDLAGVNTPDALEEIRIRYLGRKGRVTMIRKETDFKSMSPDERKAFGQDFNELKDFIENQIKDALENRKSEKKPAAAIDMTLPGLNNQLGHLHPITLVQMELEQIFQALGFMVLTGYHVESEFYNFDSLNIPSDHPARDMQDTFYITDEVLLRTHTSDTQIHFMENHDPPVRIIAPGRVYRNEDISVRSYCLFHQIEGLYVDSGVTFSELKGTLDYFARKLFGENVKTRFRPSYFPFTEPSAEMDVSCIFCKGKGCSICKKTGWLEILGCGMVDPEVYKSVKYDPDKWTGYAFGLGIERIAMLKYGVQDIRLFYSGDVRFLRQF